MKSLIKTIAVIMAVSSIALCASSCNKDTNSNNNSSIVSQHYDSVEDYYNDINIQNLIETTAQSAPDTMDFFCYVIENQFIYEYQYKTQITDAELDTAKAAFDKILEASSATDKVLMQELLELTNEENPQIVYRCLNADATVIDEKTLDGSILN